MSDNDHEKQPATVEEAARVVLEWLEPDDRAQLAATEEDDLISLHFGLAMTIRNEWLYGEGREELLEDCWRHETNELYSRSRAFYTADEASGVIAERVWALAREE